MTSRMFATLVAATLLVAPAFAQTAPATAPKPAAPAAKTAPAAAPAAAQDDGETSSSQVKACNAKWKLEKAKPGAKTDAKAYHIFMGNCL